MTQDQDTIPDGVRHAVATVYHQGFDAGRLQGYAEGVVAARVHMDHLSTTPPETQNDSPTWPPETTIEDFFFTVRTYNGLKRAGIHTISDLIKYSEADLLGIRNFNARSIDEVKERLKQVGYHLWPSPPGFEPTT